MEAIYFLNARKAVVTFVTRVAPASLSRRGQIDETLPFRLHALFIDAVTGRVLTTREWPTSSVRSRVLAVPGGNFVVFTPDQLLLYSSKMDYLGKLELSLNREAIKDSWYAHISPAGKNLLLIYEPEGEERRLAGMPLELLRKQEIEYRFEWIDLGNLQVVQSWTDKNTSITPYITGISNEGLAQTWTFGKDKNGIGGSLIPTIGRLPKGPWHLMDSSLDFHAEFFSQFINNTTVLIMRMVGGLDENTQIWMGIMSTTGKLLYQETFSRGKIGGTVSQGSAKQRSVVFSAEGKRFAIALAKIKGANTTFDIGGHLSLDRIMVFDVPSRQWIYALNAKNHQLRSVSGMALSPDGSLLALINQDGILEEYRIIETNSPAGGAIAPPAQRHTGNH